jgi:hypothetical protein
MLYGDIFGGTGLHPHRNRPGHEFIHQFVEAGLSAQMFHPGTEAVARVPSTETQLSTLL